MRQRRGSGREGQREGRGEGRGGTDGRSRCGRETVSRAGDAQRRPGPEPTSKERSGSVGDQGEGTPCRATMESDLKSLGDRREERSLGAVSSQPWRETQHLAGGVYVSDTRDRSGKLVQEEAVSLSSWEPSAWPSSLPRLGGVPPSRSCTPHGLRPYEVRCTTGTGLGMLQTRLCPPDFTCPTGGRRSEWPGDWVPSTVAIMGKLTELWGHLQGAQPQHPVGKSTSCSQNTCHTAL